MEHTPAEQSRHGLKPRLLTLLIALLVAAGCGENNKQLSNASDLFLKGKELQAAGDQAKALEAYDQSIAAEPSVWSYHERAKLHAQMGNDKAAIEDCEAALKLDPEDPDALWLKAEFAKPAGQRFQGKSKDSPGSNR